MLLPGCVKAILFAVVASLGACAVDEQPAGFGDELGTPENPVPGDESYSVQTRIEISLEMPAVTAAVGTLRAFSQAPARSLLAPTGAMPAWVATLSTTLRNNLEGYINTELDKVKLHDKTLRAMTGEMASVAENVLSTFTLESALWITPTAVQHSLSGINFTPASIDIVVPIGGLEADSIMQKPTAQVGAGGALALGDHRFSLAFGSHAWQAINLASNTLYGGDLAIIAATDCGAISRTVAARCLSSSPTTCVGHASEIENACKAGLSSMVETLRAQIVPIQIDMVRFTSGTAKLVDEGFDGVADSIIDGRWDAEIDVGQGAHKATATFIAFD